MINETILHFPTFSDINFSLVHKCIVKGCHNLELFARFYSADHSYFHQPDYRLCIVYLPPYHHRHSAFCGTQSQSSARCLSSPVSKIPLGLPINMRLHRKNGPGLIELAQQMLGEVKGWFPERQFIMGADGFYATLAGCGAAYTHIISRMRRDAAIYALPRKERKHRRGPKRKKGKRLGTPTQIASRVRYWRRVKTQERGKTKYRLVYTKVVLWYKVSHTPVLLVISRDPAGKEQDDFFFTTDLQLTAAEVIGGFAGRWSIEDTFKNIKQSLGSEEPQTWKGQGPERAAVISLWLYSVVWAWYIRYGYRKSSLQIMPWYSAKIHPSFQDALAALRRTLWRKRIIIMFGNHTVPARIIEFFIDAVASAA